MVTHVGAGVAAVAALCLLTPATAFCAAMLGATIEWSMHGSDDYDTAGTAFGGATGTTAKSDPVPGGAAGVEDTVTADLMVGDTVAVEKKWSFKFH